MLFDLTATTEAVSMRWMGGNIFRSGRITGSVSCTMARETGLRKSARTHCMSKRNSNTTWYSPSSDATTNCMADITGR